MRKLVLLFSALVLSANVFAATTNLPHDLGLAVKNMVQSENHAKMIKASIPMIYGGQDFSRHILATADESLWSGQRTLIG